MDKVFIRALEIQTHIGVNAWEHHIRRPLILDIDLGADEKDLEMPVLYAIAREGKAGYDLDNIGNTLHPLFDAIVSQAGPAVLLKLSVSPALASVACSVWRAR